LAALHFGGSVYEIILAPVILVFFGLLTKYTGTLKNKVSVEILNIRVPLFSQSCQGREIKGTRNFFLQQLYDLVVFTVSFSCFLLA